jgi:hypothetical protein
MPGYRLTEFLKTRFASSEVATYDSAALNGTGPLPPSVSEDLGTLRSAQLPALVVDGKVYTEGWLPNFLDAVALIESNRPPSRPIQAQSRANKPGGATGSSCC